MPLFGADMSTKGGLHKAITAAVALDCATVQLFTKNAAHWTAPALAESDISAFRRAVSAAPLRFLTAHDSYLINLASPDDANYASRSTRSWTRWSAPKSSG